jgi:ribosomal protein S18 acetylase RimI-like enzyme
MTKKFDNFQNTFFSKQLFVVNCCGFKVEKHADHTRVRCDLGVRWHNYVCLSSIKPSQFTSRFHEIANYFNHQPFGFWVASTTPIYGKQLKNFGFSKFHHLEAMYNKTADVIPKASDLTLKRVSTKKALNEFVKILGNYGPHVKKLYKNFQSFADDCPYQMYLGYLDDKPVACGSLFMVNGRGGIFDIYTKESERGKGFATKMTSELINRLSKLGISEVSLLSSSPEGSRVYKALGFKTIGYLDFYEIDSTALEEGI